MVAAAIWTVAGLLIVGTPGGLSAARVYETFVPAAVALLFLGVTGVKHRLGGIRRAPSWGAGFVAMWRRLDRVLDTGYDHRRSRGLGDVAGTSTATRVGILAVRAGCAFVVVASYRLAAADGSLSGRPMLWFGWFVLYAGLVALGLAVLTTDELPRGSGVLLLVASLPVFQAATMVSTGMGVEPASLGPITPPMLSTPLRVTVATLLWLTFGGAWAWLGWTLWSEDAPS